MESIKARSYGLPFVLAAAMILAPSFLEISTFVQEASFSFQSIISMLLVCGAPVIFGCSLIVMFRISQSIVLTEDGVESLRWRWPTVSRFFPVLERKFFSWKQMRRWAVKNDGMIYLYFDGCKISINTFYFKDREGVVQLINSATAPGGADSA